VRQTLVLDVVGLTPALLEHAPNLKALAAAGGLRPLTTVLPAVTTTVQSTFVTGLLPRDHGIVGNGWYFRDLAECGCGGSRTGWSRARSSGRRRSGAIPHSPAPSSSGGTTCTRRRTTPSRRARCTRPTAASCRTSTPSRPACATSCSASSGQFPLFRFWGPTADIESTRWIARSALRVLERERPTLTLVYLPHLDYSLQRLGPAHPSIAAEVAAVDALCGELIEAARGAGAAVVVLSEYGITEVSRPVHINRALRRAGWLAVREELGREQLDAGASQAFAVADHQVAHVYVARPELVPEVAALLRELPGVERVLDAEGKRDAGLDHPRSGELVAIADAHSWFTYYHFLDDDHAPDYARTVDIHRKPGYDPAELFVDPRLKAAKLRIGLRLAQKVLGMRYLMDVIPLDATLVRGSHGRLTDRAEDGPLFITSEPQLLGEGPVAATGVRDLLLDHVFGAAGAALRRTA
jgi:predicted AlkP superfamily pyrophosphatase or phosphodiesterase